MRDCVVSTEYAQEGRRHGGWMRRMVSMLGKSVMEE